MTPMLIRRSLNYQLKIIILFLFIILLCKIASVTADDDAVVDDTNDIGTTIPATDDDTTTTVNTKLINNKRNFELNISLALLNPDCFNESYPQFIINNQFPAPALHVVRNDVVRIVVRNTDVGGNQSSSIHFHGIRQYGTTFSDGVATITQLGIAPGEEFVQEFQVLNQSGTFYYHAHVGVQDDTIQGPFIVYENEDSLLAATQQKSVATISEGGCTYDEERILQWTEFWHQSFYNREDYYLGSTFTADHGPDSILLNGKTVYNTSTASKDCKGFTVIDVEPNKTYRFRFIGALTFRILGFIIQDHLMELMEIDGEGVQPYKLDYLEIAAGQRMSVLVRTGNHSVGSLFPIASNFRWRNNGLGYTNNGYGYLRYIDKTTQEQVTNIMEKPSIRSLPSNIFPSVDTPGWILSKVKPLVVTESDKAILGAAPTRTIKFSMEEVIESDNTTRYRNNGRPHIPWGNATASLLDEVLSGSLGSMGILNVTDGFSTSHQTYPLGYGEIVDLVFQNYLIPAGICVAHPWHTHGHSHYLIAEGPGDYQHEIHKDLRTFENPLLKDVSMAYPAVVNGTTACGWTKVRIYTDNPGIWAVHCHITSHMLQGKMIILESAADMIESTRRTFNDDTTLSVI